MPKFANPDEKAPDYSLLQLLRDVWGFAQPYRGKLFLISILTASREASSLYGVYAFANIVTLLSNDASAHVAEIRRVIMLLITTIAWQFISVYFSRIYGSYIVEKIGFDLELEGIRHLFKVDIAWHEKENAGNKLKRINNGTSGVQQIIRLWLNSIIQIVVTILGAIFIVAKFNFFTAAIIVVFIAVHYAMSYYLTRKAARSSYAASLQSETVSGLEVQAVSNIRTVKVMALTEPLHKKIFHEITDLYEKVRRRIFLFQTRASLLALWGQSVRLGTLIYIVFGVIRGQYELGFLILFNGYFNIIRDLAGSLSDLTQDITIARFSVSRLESLLQTPTPIEDATGKEDFPSDWKKVYIQNVAFSYGDNQVLHDISFTVTRGEKIGIVGLSGAGKSTLFKLLLKEHEDFSGSILFDEVPIQNIKATDYFKHVAVVLQETEVFNFSAEENITIADLERSGDTQALQNALSISHVQDFLPKLPNGLATIIGEKGIKLSGGEKQRLGIARAVYKKPQILLLDEATSHLDLESEEKIQDSLHQFFENVTAIVIAHRLTTIKEMDKILVIEEGKILEQGNFDELYKKQGRFFELWEKQKL